MKLIGSDNYIADSVLAEWLSRVIRDSENESRAVLTNRIINELIRLGVLEDCR